MNSIGHDIELLFEQRLRQLGYTGVCRPAREDCGVDYVLFTSKGWVGIQVKSAKANNRDNKKAGLQPARSLRAQIKKRGRGGVAYYRANGVTVFALHDRGIFYLVPIDASGTGAVCCTLDSPFREAWSVVLGLPPHAPSPEQERQTEIDTLTTLYEDAT